MKRTIFYSVTQAVTLQITGLGTVTGITNGQIVEQGVNYKLTAKPKAGNYFLGWRGGIFANDRTIYVNMSAHSTNFIARFSPTFRLSAQLTSIERMRAMRNRSS